MAKRNDPVSRARGRKAAPVKKPFPTGFVVGSTVLALALGGILYYAATHQGIGDQSSLEYAQSQVDGLHNSKDLKRNHVAGPVNYPNQKDTPPVGGDHNGEPQSCQAYTAVIANEHAVHSLEHGAAWITYNPDKVSTADVAKLKAALDDDPYRMLSPYPGLKSPISLQAWGEQLFVDKASDKRIKRFLELFTNPAFSLEPGAACQGTTDTGALATAPSTSASATPSASPTPSPSPTK